jgi:filamentous hemagglutinin
VKTLDTNSLGYRRSPKNVFGSLKKYIDQAVSFRRYEIEKYRIISGMIEGRRIELAISEGTTTEQIGEINRARAYAESLGVEFNVRVIE